MTKADEAFEKWWADKGKLMQGWSRQVWDAAWTSRGVADVEAVDTAFASTPDAIAGISRGLFEAARAGIAALDEGGGE